MSEGSRRGRRPGGADTRGAIVEAARGEFAQHGFDRTSLRGIARAAGVDPALVHHYFDGKGALFAETMHLGISPTAALARVLDGPTYSVGERLVQVFLQVWEEPERTVQLVALLRAAATHDETARTLREFLAGEIFGRVAAAVDPGASRPEAMARGSLVATQMIGLAMSRYVLQLGPVTALSHEEIVSAVGPTVQRYLLPETVLA